MDERAGTVDVVTATLAASESEEGEMADELEGVVFLVSGEGREARDGEERRREVRCGWVMVEVWG